MVVTNSGKNDITDMIVSGVVSKYVWFGVGSSNAPEDASQTDLMLPIEVTYGSGIYRKQVEKVYWDGTNIVFHCKLGQSEFNGSGSTTINEIGIFSSKDGGIMLVREVLSQSLVKDETKEYVIEVKISLYG